MRYIVAIACIVLIAISFWLLPKVRTKKTVTEPAATNTNKNFYRADTANAMYVNTGNTQPAALVSFAVTLIGIPYVYASSDPSIGFDCSGFITYVFNHFNIQVPRSSVEFTNVPYEVALNDAKPADLILFTGTDSTIHVVGHMGIIVANQNNRLLFIHSTSGKANGVTITPLNDYYMGRFVKIIRVFPQNG